MSKIGVVTLLHYSDDLFNVNIVLQKTLFTISTYFYLREVTYDEACS